jgi:hypothetical protein
MIEDSVMTALRGGYHSRDRVARDPPLFCRSLPPARFPNLGEGFRAADPDVAQHAIIERLQYSALSPPLGGGTKPDDQPAA